MRARFMRRINSSVFPLNMDPQITSIQPALAELWRMVGSNGMSG